MIGKCLLGFESCFPLHPWDSGAQLLGLPGAWDFPSHHDSGKGIPLWGM